VGGVAPSTSDIAAWDSTVTSENSTALGADLTWQGIQITNPVGPVTIGGANTLTLGTAGIDMSAAEQNLSINSNLTLAAGKNTWNVATDRALTLGAGTFSRSAGATLNVVGAGTVTTGMTGLANVNSILGPWATTGSGIDARYATLNAGVIQPYTGATALTGINGVFGGIPSGGTGTVNYDVAGSGSFSVYGLARNLNTIRYTGSGATQLSNTSFDLLTINGILNVGTGPLTIGGGTNQLRVTIGASNNLVLNAESAALTLANEIKNGASPGAVTVQGSGSNVVTLSGPNTYTGGTFVNSGRLIAGSTAMNGGPIRISRGGTLTFTGNNLVSTSTVTGGGAILNDSVNTVVFTGDHSGFSGTFTHSAAANNTQFNTATSASANAAYTLTAGELITAASGNYTLKFGSLASTGGTIRGGNTATGITTLEIGNLNTDTSIAGNLNNGATKVLALTKVGTGTLTLGGTSTYSGITTILGGTLRIDGSISATASIDNQANLVFAPFSSYTYPNVITGNGNLTLTGGGILNLTGNNNFTGNTLLEAGELSLAGAFGPIAVANDWLNVIAPATGTSFTTDSLTFNGQAELNFPLSDTPGDPAQVAITGALTTTPANGEVLINIEKPVIANGNYNLLTFGTFASNLADFDLLVPGLNSRQSASLSINGSTLTLDVEGDAPKWTGLDSGTWTSGATGASSNWKLITGGTPADFQSNDDVLFDDSATTGTTVVDIANGDVSPRMTIFSNSVLNYTLTGAEFGILTGAVTKSGTGALTIASNNLFDQGFDYQGGTLHINSANALGTGAFAINAGSEKVIDNTSGSAVVNSATNPLNWADDFTFTGTNDLDLGTGTVTASGDGADRVLTISAGTLTLGELKAPSHGLVKAGEGTLVLSSTGVGAAGSVLSGILDIAAGTLQINRSGTDAAASGDFTATGINGSGTITNGANVARSLTLQTAANEIFTGTLADGGTGGLIFNKRGGGTLTISNSNSYTGGTEIGVNNSGARIGAIRAEATQALGTGTVSIGIGGNDATARLELDGGISLSNPMIISARTTVTTTIQSTGGNNTLTGTLSITSGGSNNLIQADADTLTLSGATAVTNVTAQARFVTFQGDGNINVSGAIVNGTAGGSLGVIKSGIGTLTFGGANTYTGDTTVNQGILDVAIPVLADSAAVRIAEEGALHLSHGSSDTVSRFYIDGVEQYVGTWGGLASSATHKTSRITGTGILNVANGTTPPSGYGTWATATGLSAGVNDASTFDADADGFNNGTEYILAGLPLNGANGPKIHSLIADSSADVDSDKELVVTIAVPQGTPVFSAGAPSSTATFEGYLITVRGSTDLTTFPVVVTPVDPVVTGLPSAPVQGGITYEYRSFSLNGSNGLSGKGFLQVSVTQP
jgi:autotransporter-associated beta strand protein